MASLAACLPVWGDPLMDFGVLTAPRQRAIEEPQVSWVVHPRPLEYCQRTQPRDGSAAWQEGCVVWHKATSRCTIVTASPTTHSQLGHLFLYCIRGG
jgi:hypothetical protein